MKHLSLFLLCRLLLFGCRDLAAMARTGCERACRQRGIPLGMEQDQERCLEVGSAGTRSFLAGSRQGYDLDNDGPRDPGIGSREKGKAQGQQGFAHGRRSFQGEPAGPANRPEVGQSPAKRRDFRKEATPMGSQAQQLRFPHPGHRGRKGLLPLRSLWECLHRCKNRQNSMEKRRGVPLGHARKRTRQLAPDLG